MIDHQSVQLASDGTLLLPGLDGSNPLAFLAALGTLRVLSLDRPDNPPRMSWTIERGAWRPVLHCSDRCTTDCVIKTLLERSGSFEDYFPEQLRSESLKQSPKNKKGAPKWSGKLRFPVQVFRGYLSDVCQDRLGPCAHEFAAVWAAELSSKEYDGCKCVEPTPMNFTAGNQEFITIVHSLIDRVGYAELQEALFEPWRYTHSDPSLRWDPIDDRRYALSASDPRKQDVVTVWGANRLALEGLPLLPIVPRARGSLPAGFRRKGRALAFRWPLWRRPLTLDVVRSLLVWSQADDAALRSEIGVCEVFESTVVQPVGYYRNFSPARSV